MVNLVVIKSSTHARFGVPIPSPPKLKVSASVVLWLRTYPPNGKCYKTLNSLQTILCQGCCSLSNEKNKRIIGIMLIFVPLNLSYYGLCSEKIFYSVKTNTSMKYKKKGEKKHSSQLWFVKFMTSPNWITHLITPSFITDTFSASLDLRNHPVCSLVLVLCYVSL